MTDAQISVTSQVWRNTGNGFIDVTATVAPGLPAVGYSSVAWGDYDNDGWLDFLFTGESFMWLHLPSVAKHRERIRGCNGDSCAQLASRGLEVRWRGAITTMTDVWTSFSQDLAERRRFHLPNMAEHGQRVHECDRRGRARPAEDCLRARWHGAIMTTTGDWIFSSRGLLDSRFRFRAMAQHRKRVRQCDRSRRARSARVYGATVAWGDYDNDGRLDFFLTGPSQLWRNNTPITNTPPSAPTGLAMTATTNAVMLSWNSATDDQTPASGLTYNVRAGTTPGGNDLLSAHVNATNGFRRVPAMGNAMLRHSLPLTGLTNGQTVYWSVQAVDTAFAGGPFATETSVVCHSATTHHTVPSHQRHRLLDPADFRLGPATKHEPEQRATGLPRRAAARIPRPCPPPTPHSFIACPNPERKTQTK